MSDYFAHESSYIDDGVNIGKGTKVWHFCHVMGGTVVGEYCVLGQNVNIGKNVIIGNGCKLQHSVFIGEGVVLEDYVFLGPLASTTNDLTPRAKYPKKTTAYMPTLIREGASIGAGVTIVCGHTIGRWALIAAGAVVTKDVPDYALMAGVPARQAGWVCECGKGLPENLRCDSCGRKYAIHAEELKEEK